MRFNICTASDSYKFGHWNMYPKGTEEVYSYFESRKGATYPETMFFGLQYLLKKYLVGRVVTEEKIKRAKERVDAHLFPGAFNEGGWRYILNKHNGCLPVVIKAVPEGMVIPEGNVLMTICNVDPNCFWLTNYLETLLTHVWAPSTVATVSYHVKKIMQRFLEATSDNPDAIKFMLHDFGFRGVSSFSSAEIEGAGHLVNFFGTDTFPAVEATMDYYGARDVTAYSVPATEHSIMTALGRDGEMELLGQLLNKYPKGVLSIVIDSYNYKEFIDKAFDKFGEQILARDGKTVFRPDSGQPNEVTMEVYRRLAKHAGFTTNNKGFVVLNPKVGILWGDGIDPHGIEGILYTLRMHSISAENMTFGMGGGLLQKINRDTQRFAFKSSYQVRNGVGYEIFKSPIDGGKKSKRGRLALVKTDQGFMTVNTTKSGYHAEDVLRDVYSNGNLLVDMTFDEVRANSRT